MALSSIKSLSELYTVPPVWLPKCRRSTIIERSSSPRTSRATFELHDHFAWRDDDRADLRGLRLLRLRPLQFPRQGRRQAFILVGQLLPTAAIVVPLFVTLRWLGW